MADPTGFVLNIAIQAAIGLAIAALRPKQDIEGPRLDDLSVSSAAYGKTIPIGYGTEIVGGNIIWGQEIEEEAKEYDIGKGNPFSMGTRTEYRYFLTCAVGISRREVKDLLGIYADGKLIYDAEAIDGKPSGNLHPFLDSVPESERVNDKGNEFAPPIIKNLEFNFYKGTNDQAQDPIIAEDVGVEVCPAHRGLSYCVFNRMPLKDLGNRVPQFRFVVAWAPPPTSDLTFRNMGSDDPLYTLTATKSAVYDEERGIIYAFKRGTNGLDEDGIDENSVYLEAADPTTGDQLAFNFDIQYTPLEPGEAPVGGENELVGSLGDYLIGRNGAPGSNFADMLFFYNKETLALEGTTGDPYAAELAGDSGPLLDIFTLPDFQIVNFSGAMSAVYVPTATGTRVFAIGGTAFNAAGPSGRHDHTMATVSANEDSLGSIAWFENGFEDPGPMNPENASPYISAGLLAFPEAPNFFGFGFIGWMQGRTIAPGLVEGVIIQAEDPALPDPGYTAYLVEVNSGGGVQSTGISWRITPTQTGAIGNRIEARMSYVATTNTMIMGGSVWTSWDLDRDAIAANGGEPPIIWVRDDFTQMPSTSDNWMLRVENDTITGQVGSTGSGVYDEIDPETGGTLETFNAALFTGGDGLATNFKMQNFESGQARGLVVQEQPGERSVYGWQYLRPALERVGEPLSEVVRDIVTRGKLTDALIDVTDLENTIVKGYVIGRSTTYRKALEPLQTAYNFQGVERDGKLVFEIKRGITDIVIPEDNFVRSSRENIFEEERKDETTVPRMIFLNYRSDNLKDEKGTQHARQITDTYLTVNSKGEVTTELPLVLDDQEAKEIVERMLYESRLSLENFRFTLPQQYLQVTPGDVLQFSAANRTDSMRAAEVSVGFNLEVEVEGFLVDGDVYTQNQVEAALPYGSPGFTTATIDQLPATTVVGFVMDLPPIRPDMATGLARTAGSYFAFVAGLPPTQSNRRFVGASGQVSYTNGSDFSTRGLTSTGMAYGTVQGGVPTIPDPDYNGVQEETLTLAIGARPDAFVSVSQQEMIGSQKNVAILFNPAQDILEIIRFRDAELITSTAGTDFLRVSGLMRGQRGTNIEAQRWGEATGSTYLIIAEETALNVYTEPLARQGDTIAYRSVAAGVDEPAVQTRSSNVQLRGLKPFSPAHVKLWFDNPSGGEYEIRWFRRTRGEGSWRNQTGFVELEEDVEAYEVDILDGPGGNVVRTIETNTPSAEYTSAQIASDFGSLPVPLYCRVFQISAQVGRGYSYEAALTEEP